MSFALDREDLARSKTTTAEFPFDTLHTDRQQHLK